jgi:hypothetical protein
MIDSTHPIIKAYGYFDTALQRWTYGLMEPYEETINIFAALADPDPSDWSQALPEHLYSRMADPTMENLQMFLNDYMEYHNAIVAFFEAIYAGITKEAEMTDWVETLAVTILEYMDEKDPVRLLEAINDGVFDYLGQILLPFDIDLVAGDVMPEFDQLASLFGSEELAGFVFDLIAAMVFSEDEEDTDTESLLSMLQALIVLALAMNNRRKEIVQLQQEKEKLHHAYGKPANSPGYKVGRNDPCPCGSGKKYKKCCLPKEQMAASARTFSEPISSAKPLGRDGIHAFYRMWSKFLVYAGQAYRDRTGTPYKKVYELDADGLYTFRAYLDGITPYYMNLRKFLLEHFSDLVDEYNTKRKISRADYQTLSLMAQSARLVEGYAMETFASGHMVLYDPMDNQSYYIHRGYDRYDQLVPSSNQMLQVLLLPFRDHIITDGVMGITGIEVGTNIWEMMLTEYAASRDRILLRL